jgi:hypothetical protein
VSESEPPDAAPLDDPQAEDRSDSVRPQSSQPPAPAREEKDAPIWAQVLSIAVIVTVACWWLLLDREQGRGSEAPAASKARAAAVEEPDPQAQQPEVVDDVAAKAKPPSSASQPEPEAERTEGEPAPE